MSQKPNSRKAGPKPSGAPKKTTKKSARKSATKSTRKKSAGPSRKPSQADVIRELEGRVTELTQTNRQLKRKVFDLYTIFEISRNFNAVLDYELLLETFIFTCLGQLGSLKGAIFLRRHVDDNEFHLVRAKGSGRLPTTQDLFRDDTKLIQYVTKLNRPVLVAELSEDMAPDSEWAILRGFDKGVVVPLIHQNRLAGLFLLADKISQADFTPDDIEFLSALGNQISVAIENARLYEAEKNAMLQLRAAQEKLVQTERLAALGEMSAKIAHEVNNPLGIIK
ncbi:GAF domain-containing protein, partial [candidate division GN15 bacterium]|nr:GAF domain-containing protein [candidate division GN15 bacterium]